MIILLHMLKLELSAGASAADQEPSVELYRVPACAAWFSYQDTHSHEQRFVPEFFDGQSPDKTPGVCAASSQSIAGLCMGTAACR